MAKNKKDGKGKLRIKQMSSSELADAIRRTPIRNESLSPETLAVCRYTFSRAGKYIQPNLEKWELGFMRDTNPDKELGFWLRVCILLDLMKPTDSRQFVIDSCRASLDGNWPDELKVEWERITTEDIERVVGEAFREAETTCD